MDVIALRLTGDSERAGEKMTGCLGCLERLTKEGALSWGLKGKAGLSIRSRGDNMWGPSIHPTDVWGAEGPRYQGHHPNHRFSWRQEET